MITRAALENALAQLGIAPDSAHGIANVLWIVQMDDFFASYRTRVEVVTSEFVENVEMNRRGVVSFDDMIKSVDELRRLMIALKFPYKVMGTSAAKIDLSAHFDSIHHTLTRYFEWV